MNPDETNVTTPTNGEPTTPTTVENIDGRPCQPITLGLTGFTVFLAEYLNAGEEEDYMAVLMKGTVVKKDTSVPFQNTFESNHKRLEYAIRKILDKGGEVVKYSLAWYKALPSKDAKQISKFIIDNYTDPEKKTDLATTTE